jgi:hypothetical protein
MVTAAKFTRTGRWLAEPPTDTADSSLEVVVLHTRTEGTLRALRTAATLANGLGARIRLLVLEVVPYPLALDAPDVPVAFTRRHFHTIAADARIETNIDIRIGRDTGQMLESALKPKSVIVMGARPGWWPTPERRLANRLKRQGHQVLFADFSNLAGAAKTDSCISEMSHSAGLRSR